jgi:hypothetical protein
MRRNVGSTKDNDAAKTFNKMENRLQKSLNNVYIWCSVSIEALVEAEKDSEFINFREFEVPSSFEIDEFRIVKRKPEEVPQIIRNARNELYYSVFVFLVAQIEAYLSDIVAFVLRFDNRRLLTTVQEIKGVKAVELGDIVKQDSKEAIINLVINQQIGTLFRAAPTDQFKYFNHALGIDLDEPLKADWIEYKATRDLIVHNSGLINQIYLEKSRDAARGKVGEKIIVDKQYFDHAIGRMKQIVREVAERAKESVAQTN